MKLTNVPKIDNTDSEKALKDLRDYLVKQQQELEYQLLNLDSDNIRELDADIVRVANLEVGKNITIGEFGIHEIEELSLSIIKGTYIDANGVWTPEVYANNINTLKGKIGTAQIESLVVGKNVTMGPNAVITWANLPVDVAKDTDIPTFTSIREAAIDEITKQCGISSTEIGKAYIVSPHIVGGVIESRGSSGDGVMLTNKSMEIWSNSNIRAGYMKYDTLGAGTAEESANRVFLGTMNGYALKIHSDANMSIDAKGKIYIGDCVFTGTVNGGNNVAVFG